MSEDDLDVASAQKPPHPSPTSSRIVRLLVYGGRNYPSGDTYNWLERYAEQEVRDVLKDQTARIGVVIEGGADGADRGAFDWGRDKHLAMMRFPAKWRTHGKSAGPRRNQLMVNQGKPDVGIEFPGARGTADMAARLLSAGVPIILAKPKESAARHEMGAARSDATSNPPQSGRTPPMSEDVTLAACPFCHGKAYPGKDDPRGWYVECLDGDCGGSTRDHETHEAAIAAWNRRPPVPGWLEAKEACAKVAEQRQHREDKMEGETVYGEKYGHACARDAAQEIAEAIRALTPPGVRGEKKD